MQLVESLYEQYRGLTAGNSIAAAILTVADAILRERPTAPPDEGPLTVREAAKRLGVCEWTVRNLVNSGKLLASRIGRGRGTLRFDPAHIKEYMKESAGHRG